MATHRKHRRGGTKKSKKASAAAEAAAAAAELRKAVEKYFNHDPNIKQQAIKQYGPISDWNTSKIQNMKGIFKDIDNTNEVITLNWDTRNVTTMEEMFAYCKNNFILNFTSTENVKNMEKMFVYATNFNSPVNFDTKNVTSMRGMFYGAKSFNQPIDFNATSVKYVRNLEFMFFGAKKFNNYINISLSPNIARILNIVDLFDFSDFLVNVQILGNRIINKDISIYKDLSKTVLLEMANMRNDTELTKSLYGTGWNEFDEYLGHI